MITHVTHLNDGTVSTFCNLSPEDALINAFLLHKKEPLSLHDPAKRNDARSRIRRGKLHLFLGDFGTRV